MNESFGWKIAGKAEAGSAVLREGAAKALQLVRGEPRTEDVVPAAAGGSIRAALCAMRPSSWALIGLGIAGIWFLADSFPDIRRYAKMKMM